MMRVDYRCLRLVSLPGYLARASRSWSSSSSRRSASSSAGVARWLQSARCRRSTRPRSRSSRLIIYLAHWLRPRGSRISGFRSGTMPFLLISLPVIGLVFKEPDLGTTVVIAPDGLHDVLRRRRPALAVRRRWACRRRGRCSSSACSGYQVDRDPDVPRPLDGSARRRLSHDPGPARPRPRRDLRRRPRREQARRRPVPARTPGTTSSSRSSARSSGSSGRSLVIALFAGPRLRRHPDGPRARRTRSARCSPPGSPPGCASRPSSTSASSSRCCPSPGITLPFISAGGSSLIFSFAAVGILLSISRETVERGNLEPDAAADRGRGNGRTHLPGSRRRGRSCAAAPNPPELAWLGGHRGLEAAIVPRAGHPAATPRRCAPCGRVDRDSTSCSIRSGSALSVPAGDGDPRQRAPGRDLHDRRLRRHPGPDRGRGSLRHPGAAVGGQRHSRPERPGDRRTRLGRRGLPSRDLRHGRIAAGAGGRASRPARRSATSRASTAPRPASALGVPPDERLLLVFGGSQAVRRLNDAVAEALPRARRAGRTSSM